MVWTSPLTSVGISTFLVLLRVFPSESVVFIEHRGIYLLMLFCTCIKTTIHPLMEHRCHIWAGAPAYHLSLPDQLQKCTVNLVGAEMGSTLQPLSLTVGQLPLRVCSTNIFMTNVLLDFLT